MPCRRQDRNGSRGAVSSAGCTPAFGSSGFPSVPSAATSSQDFIWVSGIQGSLVAAGFISGLQFAVEEVLLFSVLVLVKHRLPSIFDRFTQSA